MYLNIRSHAELSAVDNGLPASVGFKSRPGLLEAVNVSNEVAGSVPTVHVEGDERLPVG